MFNASIVMNGKVLPVVFKTIINLQEYQVVQVTSGEFAIRMAVPEGADYGVRIYVDGKLALEGTVNQGANASESENDVPNWCNSGRADTLTFLDQLEQEVAWPVGTISVIYYAITVGPKPDVLRNAVVVPGRDEQLTEIEVRTDQVIYGDILAQFRIKYASAAWIQKEQEKKEAGI